MKGLRWAHPGTIAAPLSVAGRIASVIGLGTAAATIVAPASPASLPAAAEIDAPGTFGPGQAGADDRVLFFDDFESGLDERPDRTTAATIQRPGLPEAERLRLAGAFELSEAIGDDVWPGWNETPFGVVLVADDQEFLVHPPAAATGIEERGFDELLGAEVAVRPRTQPPNLLATFPLFGPPAVVVIGTAEATGLSSTAWVLTLAHEHFHQMQMGQTDYFDAVDALGLSGGDTSGMWMLNYPFPYDDVAVQASLTRLGAALSAALAPGSPATVATLGTVRQAFGELKRALEPDDWRYLSFQLWQEGVARYVEYRAAVLAAERFSPSPAFIGLPGSSATWRRRSAPGASPACPSRTSASADA